jgi:hypothetical protein
MTKRPFVKATQYDAERLLLDQFHYHHVNSGELIDLNNLLDIVIDAETRETIKFSKKQIIWVYHMSIELFADSMIQNCHDTEISEYFTEEDRDRRILEFDNLRPEIVRANELKTWFKTK